MPIGDRVTVSGARYPDPVTIGPYHVERRLTDGRHSFVYECSDASGTRVCAKLMAPLKDESGAEAAHFFENARAALALKHKHVAQVLDADRLFERPYVVLELVDGSDLAKVVARDGALRARAALEAVRQVASALDAGRRMGLLHGDVRPRHMLMGKDGLVKLIGFGLSPRWTTAHGREIGADPAYLAPEHAQGRALDHRSDIYSLGCSLFELLTARTPFGVGAPDALLACHLHEPFPRASQLTPNLPAEVDELLRAMGAKNPNGRPQSYAELVERIDAVLPALRSEKPSGPVLVVEVGRQPGVAVELPDGDLLIGRCEDEGFFLDDGRVSRRHALVRRLPDGIFVEDLGSKNGIRVNGATVDHGSLHPGDRLGIGDSILVLVADEVSEPVPEAASRSPGASPVRGAFGDDEVAHGPGTQARATQLEHGGLEEAPLLLRGISQTALVLAQTLRFEEAGRRISAAMGGVLGADAWLWVDVEDGHPRLAAASGTDAQRLSCVLPAVERALPGHLSLSTSVRAGRSGYWGVALAPVRLRDEEVRGFVVLVSFAGRFSEAGLSLLEAAAGLLSERATAEAVAQSDGQR